MAQVPISAEEEILRDIEEDLKKYSEIETIFNRVLVSLFAWTGGNNFGKNLLKAIWNNAYQTPYPEFREIEIHREFKLEKGLGKTIWPDIVILDGKTFWMFETKTDMDSVRSGQLAEQVFYARRILGNRQLYVLAVSPSEGAFQCPEGITHDKFSEITWKDISNSARICAELLCSGIARNRCMKFTNFASDPTKFFEKRSKNMNHSAKWKLGMKGLMALPDPESMPGEKDRPYFVVEILSSNECKRLTGPFRWATAKQEAMELGRQKKKPVFRTPEGKQYEELIENGYLKWCVG